MSIKSWPADDRPREKLLAKGAGVLSDAELLAIFLRVGVRGKSAVDLARLLLQEFGSLHGLFGADLDTLSKIPGMGPAKFVQLQAVMEMARRALGETLQERDVLSSPQSVRDYLRIQLQSLGHEVFVGIFLNARNQVIAADTLSEGTLTQTSVFPREIVKRALTHNAAAVIFAHNHPSGTTEPSQADRHLTRALADALRTIDIRVLDHLVVAPGRILSFAEQGLMPYSG
ncbi:MAG: DNA repair protein RadC [Burkholderiales bacterium]|nr:DNA repair protein RadC [Burkholderiales bacterium]